MTDFEKLLVNIFTDVKNYIFSNGTDEAKTALMVAYEAADIALDAEEAVKVSAETKP